MSNKLVQIHFDFHGSFGAEMLNQLVELTESINQEPEFIWKIQTENEASYETGGICLFQDEDTAQTYIRKRTARLKHLGVEEVTLKIFDINEPLSKINHGHIGQTFALDAPSRGASSFPPAFSFQQRYPRHRSRTVV